MNTPAIPADFAAFPLTQVPSGAFLGFYICALILCFLWAVRRAARGPRAFETAEDPGPLDVYEQAWLAGGAGRVTQLAVVRLLHGGHLEFKKAVLHAGPNPATEGLYPLEAALLAAVKGAGAKGLKPGLARDTVQPMTRPMEVRLASLGLRPTEEERRGFAGAGFIPFVILAFVGFVRLCFGVMRHQPVWFLIVLLIATLIAAIVAVQRHARLTPKGRLTLDRLRGGFADKPTPQTALPEVSSALALMGPACLLALPVYASAVSGLENMHRVPAAAGSSGGCGSCGSSHGSSGGGCGGGCGGCGGGGD